MSARSFPRSIYLVIASIVLALGVLIVTLQSLASVHASELPTTIIVVNPGDSIQAAIDSATAGDTIVINPGTYTESLTLNKPVSLTGVNSATVIIHAVANQRVLTVTGGTITDSTIISGLTLTGGNIAADSPDASKGGGLLLKSAAQPSIYNVAVIGNIAQYGGGIYADTGSPLFLHNVRIEGNVATYTGGGALTVEAVTLDGCRVENNRASLVGGMRANNTVVFTDTQFISNSATSGVGGLEAGLNSSFVGGRFERNNPSGLSTYSAIISGTRFISNTAGGAYCGGTCFVTNGWFERNTDTALVVNSHYPLTLIDSVFLQNTSGWAGGVDAYTATIRGGAFVQNTGGFVGALIAGTLDLSGTQFISNTGGAVATLFAARITGARFEGNQGTYGGGLYAKYALALTNTTFVNNSATYGGGVYHAYFYDDNFGDVNDDARVVNTLFAHNTASSKGAALYLSAVGKVDILHTTIADNALNSRAALIVSGTVGLTNTIITSHAVGIERIGGNVHEDYNLFYGNTTNVTGTVSGGTHDVYGNPNFVDPTNDNYHIAPPSAAINAGVDAGVYTDLDGNMRPWNGGYDIGAYEAVLASVPITGLSVANNGPTALGQPMILSATIEAGDLVTYRWDFGDGSLPGSGNPITHTYPTAGIYTAIVTASNSLNALTATTTVTVYVTPITGLVATNSSPNALDQPTTFTATINAGDLVSYSWSFGDSSSTVNGITATHIYSAVRVYTATVTAMNSVSVLTATTRVTITDVPISGLNATNNSPTAIGSVTTLTATISTGSTVTYTWNFGDGSLLALGQVAIHTYPFSTAFRFTATVTATNSVNAQTAATTVIIIPKRVYLPLVLK